MKSSPPRKCNKVFFGTPAVFGGSHSVRPALLALMMAFAGVASGLAGSYQYITDAGNIQWNALLPDSTLSGGAVNWTSGGGWDGKPANNAALQNSTLAIAASSVSTGLVATDGQTSNYNLLSFSTSGTNNSLRTLVSSTGTTNLAITNNLTISSGADLKISARYDAPNYTPYFVSVGGNLTVGTGGTLYLGSVKGGASDSNASRGPTSFVVTGSTILSGTLVNSRKTIDPNLKFGDVTLNSGGAVIAVAQSATTNFGTGTATLGMRSLAGSGTIYGSNMVGAQVRSATIAITTATNSNATFSGVLSDSSVVTVGTNQLSLTVSGSGRQTLTGVNTYTGSTTINGGTLIVSGSGSINSTAAVSVTGASSTFRYDSSTGLSRNISVTSGATFRYNSGSNYTGTLTWTNGSLGGTNWNGNLGGLTVSAGRTITPGNSVGSATTTSQTWGPGGTYAFEVQNATGAAGTGWDLITMTGALTLAATEGSPFVIALSSLDGDGNPGGALNFLSGDNYNWLIADAGSAISGFSSNLFSVNTAGFANAFDGAFSVVLGDSVLGGDNTQLYLQYSAVPEPTSLSTVAAALVLLSLGYRIRRRRKITG